MVWVWARRIRDRRGYRPAKAFAVATAASVLVFVAVFVVLSLAAGVGLGWLTALAGSVKIINWLTVPTAVANLTNVVIGLVVPVNFYAVLETTRIIGIADHRDLGAIAVVALPPHRPGRAGGHRAGDGRRGAVRARCAALVLHLAAGDDRRADAVAAGIALIAGFSTWIIVIWNPDGAHGMYSWVHVLLAVACAGGAWYWLYQPPNRLLRSVAIA